MSALVEYDSTRQVLELTIVTRVMRVLASVDNRSQVPAALRYVQLAKRLVTRTPMLFEIRVAALEEIVSMENFFLRRWHEAS